MDTEPVPTSHSMQVAFSLAQGAFKAPKKTKHYLIQGKPVKYADLADVLEAVREPLEKNGFSHTAKIGFTDGLFGLTTILMHSSGESMQTWYPLPDQTRQNIRQQDFGGALTYARRYSLSALLGVASDEDTDAQGAPDIEKAIKPANGKQPAKVPIGQVMNALKPDVPPPDQFDSFPPEDESDFGPPPDAAPLPEFTMLDQLSALCEEKSIKGPQLYKIVAQVLGGKHVEHPSKLSFDECSKVVAFVKMLKSNKPE